MGRSRRRCFSHRHMYTQSKKREAAENATCACNGQHGGGSRRSTSPPLKIHCPPTWHHRYRAEPQADGRYRPTRGGGCVGFAACVLRRLSMLRLRPASLCSSRSVRRHTPLGHHATTRTWYAWRMASSASFTKQSRGRRRDQWYEWDGEVASSKWSQGQ